MRTLQELIIAIVFIILFSSCQSNSISKQDLSNKETRKGIMDTIVNNSDMLKEMMVTMMNSNNGKKIMLGNEKMTMLVLENNRMMMKIVKNNPEMMQRLMSDIIKTAKSDSGMMNGMSKIIMGDPQMMDLMLNIKGENTSLIKTDGEKNTNMTMNRNNKTNNMEVTNNSERTNNMEEMNNIEGMNDKEGINNNGN
jgi:hypothetical protein